MPFERSQCGLGSLNVTKEKSVAADSLRSPEVALAGVSESR